MKALRFGSMVAAAALAGLLLAQCSVVQEGAKVLGDTGKISEKDKDSIVKTSEAVRTTFSEITEQEEYYIGRAVSALILSRYKVLGNTGLTDYVNTCGRAISYSSDRPETYGGYHFLVLDTDEVNALAAPGGFVFITKGLLKRCKDEEMMASILAHEIGHVSAKHGLASIKKSRLVDAFKILGKEAATRYGSKELAQLTGIFENVLGDIVESLVEKGYDRKYEYEADKLGAKYARDDRLRSERAGPVPEDDDRRSGRGRRQGLVQDASLGRGQARQGQRPDQGNGGRSQDAGCPDGAVPPGRERAETLTGPGRMSRKLVRGLAVGGAVFLVALLVHSLGVFESLEWKSWDLRLRLFASASRADTDIALVLIDQESLDVYEKSAEPALAVAAPDLCGHRGLSQGRRGEGGLLRPHPERGLALRGRGRRGSWPER